MTPLFVLYLVLLDKPRMDDSNIVATSLTMQQCEEASGAYNGAHHAMEPGAQPRHLWICGSMPPGVDHHEDLLGHA